MTAEPEQLIKALAAVGRGFDSGAPVPLATRTDGVVVRVGGVVVKAHPAGTDPASLAARLGIAAGLAGVLLAPVRQPGGEWLTRVADRLVTVWPAGEPVDPDDPDAAPWERAATLLARLHRSGAGPSTAPDDVVAGAPGRVARALARLHRAPDHPGTPAVRAAYRSLPRWVYG
ncbi:MAG: hypothetical protein ACRDT4_22810, partial [Micromonosporaceae bacterium]